MSAPVFGVAGYKNSGKTTLVERLVRDLSERGVKVSTLKHAHHNFEIDHPGRDSHRHRAAGAHEVAIVSRNRWAVIHELHGGDEPDMEQMLAKLAPFIGYPANAFTPGLVQPKPTDALPTPLPFVG